MYPGDVGLDTISDVIVDSTGATYVVGTGTIDNRSMALVAELDPTGKPDHDFGKVSISFGGFPLSRVTGAALLRDDDLVISGQGSAGQWIVAQISTFKVVNLSAVLGASLDGNPRSTIVPLADGSLLLSASVYDNSFRYHIVLVRLHDDLSLDTSFGSGGYVLDPIPPAKDEYSVGLGIVRSDSLGRILVSAFPSPFARPVIARFTPKGALDTSFATSGMLDQAAPTPAFYFGCGWDFVLDAHDRILTVCVRDPLDGNAGVSRYRSDGTLDATFGEAGTARVPPAAGSSWSVGTTVAVQGDSVLLGGRTRDSATIGAPTDFAVWHFTADGRLDRSFGTRGGVVRGLDGVSDSVRSVEPGHDATMTILLDTNVDVGGAGPNSIVRLRPGSVPAPPPLTLLDAPARVLDTRSGLPAGTAKLLAGHVLTLQIAGLHGISADAGGVVLNVTVTEPEAPGYLTAYPCGQPPPVASNINYVRGQTIANLVISRLGAGGAICIFSSQTTHVVADVTGAQSAIADVHPLPSPLRLIDTRIALGWILPMKVGPWSPNPGLFTPTISLSQIPSSQWVDEAIFNVTITEPDRDGYLTVFQCGATTPLASNLNFSAGETISNLVAVRMSSAASSLGPAAICFRPSTTTHMVVDLEATVDVGAADITLPQPTRVLDTRIGTGAPIGKTIAGVPMELQLGPPHIGNDALAVGINVTSTEPDAAGYLTVYPCGQPPPLASNVNFVAGETIPNYVIVRLGRSGRVCIVSSTPTHVIADLTEFFTPVS